MSTRFYWIDGPWAGKLALSARPRGGDWLKGEIDDWRRAGINSVLSLLTPQEELDLDLRDEVTETRKLGLEFTSFPIPDRQVPPSQAKLGEVLDKLNKTLSAGRNVLVHCRQGIGRAGLVGACLLIKNGMSPGAALDALSAARGVAIPETMEQRNWIERYAPVLTK